MILDDEIMDIPVIEVLNMMKDVKLIPAPCLILLP